MTTQILVVDDCPSERLFIGHFLLAHHDLQVAFAANGEEALRFAADKPPDVIVSDLRMPVMNGLELVQRLNTSGSGIPVILMTSFGSEQTVVEALEAGAASYVPKKILQTRLVDTIRSVIEVTQRRTNRQRTLECLSYSESRFVMGNDASTVPHVVSHLLDTAVSMKLLKAQEQTQTGIALQEALSNAIHRGNLELDPELRNVDERVYHALADARRDKLPFSDRLVTVEARLSRLELRFTVTDEGRGFGAAGALHSGADMNLDRMGDRGLLLISSFMDEVFHNERGNQITMVKYVAACPAEDHSGRTASRGGKQRTVAAACR